MEKILKEIKKEFEYSRKAAVAKYNKKYIAYYIYDKISSYYANKYLKKFINK